MMPVVICFPVPRHPQGVCGGGGLGVPGRVGRDLSGRGSWYAKERSMQMKSSFFSEL